MNIPEPTEREYLLQIERLLRNACMCRTDAQWLAFVRGEIEKKLELAEKLEAPVAPGTRAGVIAYYFNGEKLGELPVTAAEAVERAGYKDHLQKVFKGWISIRRTDRKSVV